jgi:hypothetical protein
MGGLGYHGNPIQSHGYSELSVPPNPANAGSALGHLPYLTRMRIRAGGHQVVAEKQDIGAGSSFNPVMGLYPGTVAELGLHGGEFRVSIERADGQPLSAGTAGATAHIRAPHVTGSGAIAALIRAGLGKVTGAANAYLGAHGGSEASGGSVTAAGGVPTGGGFSASQLGSFDGFQVAKWAIPELQYARAHGWTGPITSGYRAGADPKAPGGSMHALDIYPGGAVDFGGEHEAAARANRAAFIRATAGYTGRRLLTPIGFVDDGHMSGTGHARGGLLNFARGGMLGFAGGTPHIAHHAAPKVGKPKGVTHVKKPHASKKVTFAKLITNLSSVPGMRNVAASLAQYSTPYNTMVGEGELLSQMDSNPASILHADMAYLSPTLVPGENISPGMLVPPAEREQQRAVQRGGESEGLSLQGSLLSWIGGLDDHRLLTDLDIGVLAKDWSGLSGGVPLEVGNPVFASQLHVLEWQKRMQEALVTVQKKQLAKARALIQQRRNRRIALQKLAAATYARYQRMKRHLAVLKTAGLHRRLGTAKHRQMNDELARDAQAQDSALSGAIEAERGLPKQERNESLIAHWQSEKRMLASYASSLRSTGGSAVTSAKEAVERNALQGQMVPVEESLHLLTGSSTSYGSSGEIGAIGRQVTSLRSGASELEGKITDEQQGTIPQLALSIGQLVSQLKESAESVAPAKIPGTGATDELASAIQAQLEEKLRISKEETRISDQALSVFGGPGDIGVGASTALAAAAKGARGGLFAALGELPPFGGSFKLGGIVPGPVGTPKMILAHGGERVTPVDKRREEPQIVMHVNTLHPGDPATLTAIGKAATAGIGFQGLRQSKRFIPGI